MNYAHHIYEYDHIVFLFCKCKKKKKSENEEKANSLLSFFLPFCNSLLPVNIREAIMGLREKKNKKIKLQGLNIGKKHVGGYEDAHENKGQEVETKMKKSRGLKK